MLRDCQYCHTRVLPEIGGVCPHCGRLLGDAPTVFVDPELAMALADQDQARIRAENQKHRDMRVANVAVIVGLIVYAAAKVLQPLAEPHSTERGGVILIGIVGMAIFVGGLLHRWRVSRRRID